MTESQTIARDCQLVVFTLDGDEYALPIEQVQEIIRHSEPRQVSSDQPWIAGVISLRGKIIPVCDLACRLGQSARPHADAKIVIVEVGDQTAGIIVDDVSEVVTVGAGQFEPISAVSSELIDTLAKFDQRLVAVLDPAKLLLGVLAG